jgi:3-methyladenine DNA glycosylase AlkD
MQVKERADAIVAELRKMGSETTKRTLMRHGAPESIFGVKIGDLKKIEKRVKTDHELALALFDTGIGDAMYLAGLIADDEKMTKKDLQRWMKQATWSMVCEYTVPWVAAGSKHGYEIALEWIESKDERIAAAGWNTLGGIVATKEDAELDIAELKRLLAHIRKTIHNQPNMVRYTMNGFVIAVAAYVKSLTALATETAEKIGEVSCDLPGACKVPYAPEYIEKIKKRGSIGKKRKTMKC